jgi:hypothetical protein
MADHWWTIEPYIKKKPSTYRAHHLRKSMTFQPKPSAGFNSSTRGKMGSAPDMTIVQVDFGKGMPIGS